MEPENHTFEKENHLPNLHFLASMLVFGGKNLILQSQGTAVAGIDTVATGIVSFRAGGAGAAGAAGGAARLPETATPLEGSTVARKDSGSKRNI